MLLARVCLTVQRETPALKRSSQTYACLGGVHPEARVGLTDRTQVGHPLTPVRHTRASKASEAMPLTINKLTPINLLNQLTNPSQIAESRFNYDF